MRPRTWGATRFDAARGHASSAWGANIGSAVETMQFRQIATLMGTRRYERRSEHRNDFTGPDPSG